MSKQVRNSILMSMTNESRVRETEQKHTFWNFEE